MADWYDRNAEGENDHYTQPGIFYREVLPAQDKANLVNTIVGAMSGISGPKKAEIINRQLCHFFPRRYWPGNGHRTGLGLDMASLQQHMPAESMNR